VPPEHFSHEAAQQVSVPSLRIPLWQNHSGSGGGGGGNANPTQPTSMALRHGVPVLSTTSLQHRASPPSRSAHFEPPEHFSHEAAQHMSVSSLRIPLWQNHSGSGGGGGGGGGRGGGGSGEGDGGWNGGGLGPGSGGSGCGGGGADGAPGGAGGDAFIASAATPTQPTSELLWHSVPLLSMT